MPDQDELGAMGFGLMGTDDDDALSKILELSLQEFRIHTPRRTNTGFDADETAKATTESLRTLRTRWGMDTFRFWL